MNDARRTKTTFALIAYLGLMPLFAACGGGDDGGDVGTLADVGSSSGASNSSSSNDCNLLLLLLSLGTLCVDDGNQSSSPPTGTSPGSTSGPVSSGGSSSGNTRQARIGHFTEFEPNSTLDNANLIQLPVVTDVNTSAGIDIVGSVQDDTDRSDFFIFTPSRSDAYLVYLCADTCAEQVNDDAVYLMVYDQNQTTIASTTIGIAEEQRLVVELTAGLAYYVEVHGYATANMPYPYKLVIID